MPWPQKGDAVTIPLGDTAPVYGDGLALGLTSNGANTFGLVNNASGYLSARDGNYNKAVGTAMAGAGPANSIALGVVESGHSGLEADLSAATATTINELREAFQIQKLLERDARGGTRYTEIIRSHFGVISPDARLQRPEYLGGGSSMISVNPVVQTSQSDNTPQGNMAAYGTHVSNGTGFTKSFTEHCVIIGLANVRADLNYQQGLYRDWETDRKSTRLNSSHITRSRMPSSA